WIDDIDAQAYSMTMGAYQPQGKLTAHIGDLTSDVFIDDQGRKEKIRVQLSIPQGLKAKVQLTDGTEKSLFDSKVWPRSTITEWQEDSSRYSFKDLSKLFDMESTVQFLDVDLEQPLESYQVFPAEGAEAIQPLFDWEERLAWVIRSRGGKLILYKRGLGVDSSEGKYTLFSSRGHRQAAETQTIAGLLGIKADTHLITMNKQGDPNYAGPAGFDSRGVYMYKGAPSKQIVIVHVMASNQTSRKILTRLRSFTEQGLLTREVYEQVVARVPEELLGPHSDISISPYSYNSTARMVFGGGRVTDELIAWLETQGDSNSSPLTDRQSSSPVLPGALDVNPEKDLSTFSSPVKSEPVISVLLVGPAAAGKGTSSRALMGLMEGFAHVSTGEILREEQEQGTELGQRARDYMDAGQLVPDVLIIDMVKVRIDALLREGKKGFIFDGFPRTQEQTQQLDKMLEEIGLSVNVVIIHDITDEMLEERRKTRIEKSIMRVLKNKEQQQLTGLLDKLGIRLYDAFIQAQIHQDLRSQYNIKTPSPKSDTYKRLNIQEREELEPLISKGVTSGANLRPADIDINRFNIRQNDYKNVTLSDLRQHFNSTARGSLLKHIEAGIDKSEVPSIIEPALRFAKAHAGLTQVMKRWDSLTTGNKKIAAIETAAHKYNLSAVDTLSLYQLVEPEWRSQEWESAVAEYKDNPSDSNKEKAQNAINSFLEETRISLYIDNPEAREDLDKLSERIAPFWLLRWFYFNTTIDEISPKARGQALEFIFTSLEGNTSSGDTLWKNAEAVLTEIMIASNSRIWKPALEKSFIYLADENKRDAWENISESINLIRINKNPALVGMLMDFMLREDADVQAKTWLAKKVLPEVLSSSSPTKAKNEELRYEYITALLAEFEKAMSSRLRKALAYTLGTIGDLRIKEDLIRQLKENKEEIRVTPSGQERALQVLLGRRTDVIKILSLLRYEEYPTELRDELVWIVLYGRDGLPAGVRARAEAGAEVAAQTLMDLDNLPRPAIVTQEEDSDLVEILGGSKKQLPLLNILIPLIEDQGSILTLQSLLNRLMAVKKCSFSEAMSIVERSTGAYFDNLINYIIVEGAGYSLEPVEDLEDVSAEDFLRNTAIDSDIVFGENVLTIDGRKFEFQNILGDSHSNPVALYRDPDSKIEVLVKSGNDYSVMIEYIGNKLFALVGLPVPKMSIVKDDSSGRFKLVIEFLGNYTGNVRRLSRRFHNDAAIKSAVLMSMLIDDKDRSPWNMMFMKIPLDITQDQIEQIEESLVMHIDFGSAMFSKPTSGFTPFKDYFLGTIKDFITSIRHNAVAAINPAYENAITDREFMNDLAKRLHSIKNEQIEAIVRAAVTAIGLEDRERAKSQLDNWIQWSELENKNGSWNRKPRSNRQEPIVLFKNIIEHIARGGTLHGYLADMLKRRRDDILIKEFILRPALLAQGKVFHRKGYDYKWSDTEILETHLTRYNFVAEKGKTEIRGYLLVEELAEDKWSVELYWAGNKKGKTVLALGPQIHDVNEQSSSPISSDMLIDNVNISSLWRDMVRAGKLATRLINTQTGDEVEVALVLTEEGLVEYRAYNITKDEVIPDRMIEETIPGTNFEKLLNPYEGLLEKAKVRIPGRQPEMPPHEEKCGFSCTDDSNPRSMLNREPVFEIKANGTIWRAYPKRVLMDKNGHLVLMPDITESWNRRGQKTTFNYIKDVINIANRSRNISILFNSLHAGASINHIHFHLVYHGEVLAIEQADFDEKFHTDRVKISISNGYETQVIMLEGKDEDALSTTAFGFINRLNKRNIPHNIMVIKNRVYIMPRDIEHEVVEEFPRAIGIRELCGKFVGFNKEMFDKITKERISLAFKKLSLSRGKVLRLINAVATEQSLLAQADIDKQEDSNSSPLTDRQSSSPIKISSELTSKQNTQGSSPIKNYAQIARTQLKKEKSRLLTQNELKRYFKAGVISRLEKEGTSMYIEHWPRKISHNINDFIRKIWIPEEARSYKRREELIRFFRRGVINQEREDCIVLISRKGDQEYLEAFLDWTISKSRLSEAPFMYVRRVVVSPRHIGRDKEIKGIPFLLYDELVELYFRMGFDLSIGQTILGIGGERVRSQLSEIVDIDGMWIDDSTYTEGWDYGDVMEYAFARGLNVSKNFSSPINNSDIKQSSSPVLPGALIEDANFARAMAAQSREDLRGTYYDVISINVKQGKPAEELAKKVESWRGIYYPQDAIIFINQVPDAINKGNLNGMIFSIIET
ncbi:nucleoside monophosphate kinase, partial [Candidatus Omnitrophota bacterium]